MARHAQDPGAERGVLVDANSDPFGVRAALQEAAAFQSQSRRLLDKNMHPACERLQADVLVQMRRCHDVDQLRLAILVEALAIHRHGARQPELGG
jgi:hypothetical protein